MKKIGILTFHRSINYGAYVQCLSLSHFLAEKYPDCKVEVIDYESKFMRDNYVPKISLSYIRHPLIFKAKKKQYKCFKDALRFLPLSNKYFAFDGTDEKLGQYVSENYDIVVVGSDAVFNWLKRGFPNPYILPFKDVKKLSYAASAYGMPLEKISDSTMAAFGEYLKDFSFVGVRDDYTSDLIRRAEAQTEPVFTCDPTVFLDIEYVLMLLGHTKESFKEYIYKKFKLPKDKKLVGVMESNSDALKAIKSKYGEELFFVGFYSYTKGVDKFIADISPLEWALLFGLFEFTITNYFHGTLLSLRNNTPVLSFDRTSFSKTNEGKIHDVMRRMDLLDCLFEGQYTIESVVDQADKIMKTCGEYKKKIAENIDSLKDSKATFERYMEELL